jgi:suppressor of fused
LAEFVDAPGWDAIEAALSGEHGPSEPAFHFATDFHQRVISGGPEAIDGFSAYRATNPDHWHVVTFGMSELYTKDTDDPDLSGWGFELTIRTPWRDDQAPMWTVGLLQRLANRTRSHARRALAVGDRINNERPIAGQSTALTALIFTEDPNLGTIDTPHGRVQFLQVVGITHDELLFAKQEGSDQLLELLRRREAAHRP